MSVKEFEFYHGVVLTKILRCGPDVTLRMVETKTKLEWATYIINDAVRLVVVHSSRGRATKNSARITWTPTLSPNTIKQILQNVDGKPTHLACVLVDSTDEKREAVVCLLYPREIQQLELSSGKQSAISITLESNKQLVVARERGTIQFRVPRNRIDKWSIAGS